MRSLVLIATLGVLSLAPSAASAGVFGYFDRPDMPYCIQGRDYGIPGLCQFRSYEECEATASGTFGYCNINPRFAFAQPGPFAEDQPLPPPPHHRHHHHHQPAQ
jgi:Protein of unknown function (DUF3551)